MRKGQREIVPIFCGLIPNKSQNEKAIFRRIGTITSQYSLHARRHFTAGFTLNRSDAKRADCSGGNGYEKYHVSGNYPIRLDYFNKPESGRSIFENH
jgi:hypothetical protein